MTATPEAARLPTTVAPATPAGTEARSPRPGALSRWPVGIAVLVGSIGLSVQVGGYILGWHGQEPRGTVLWYVGFVLIVAPFAALLRARTMSDHRRLGASVVFALLIYGSWLLSNPVMSTRYDESLHVTTLVDLVQGGGFFANNAMLPVSPHYPGLELATSAVFWLTGLPLIVCQIVIVLLARTVFVVGLFLIASRIGRSTRVGQIAVLLYAGTVQFYFFNAQYSYQTVAIAMLMAATYLLVRAYDAPAERPWAPLIGVQVCLGGLTITHHLTSWLMLLTLWLLTGLFWISRDRRKTSITLVTAELATAVSLGWTALIAPLLVQYLGPIFESAGSQISGLLESDGGGRSIGSDSSGVATPHWETGIMFLSILVWVLLLMPSCWAAWRSSSIGRSKARYLPLVLAAAYPFLQLTRFSASAGEIGDRASTFVGMAMALLVGVWLAPRVHRLGLLVVPLLVVLVLGGTILGSGPDWQRMDGAYISTAEQRSVDSETIAVAQWAGRYLPAGSRIAADTTFDRVLPNFAPVVSINQAGGPGQVNVTPLYISTSIDAQDIALIQQGRIDFVVVDTRMIGQAARSGENYTGSAGFGEVADTLDAQQLDKFQGASGFDLVLDGPVRIYDVRSLRGAPSTYADRPAPGIPGQWRPVQVTVLAVILLLGLLLRGRLLDPRRFRARHYWRIAVLLPAGMVIGAIGVVAGFEPWVGSVLLVVLAGGVLLSTTRPARLAQRTSAPVRVLTAAVVTVLTVATVLAATNAYHALYDHGVLPPPLNATSAVTTSGGGP